MRPTQPKLFADHMKEKETGVRFNNEYLTKLENFWASKHYKIYVVRLVCQKKRGKRLDEVKYIRVNGFFDDEKTRYKAALSARNNSVVYFSGKNVGAKIRLADPESDLGCVWSGSEETNPLRAA